MAAKWADWLISAVRYDAFERHIEQVRVHADNVDSVGSGHPLPRPRVVSLLAGGSTFTTIIADREGKWARGADVRVVTVGGVKFIRTDRDHTTGDNLGSLPRF